jgi:pimeloyl-ACP methyl ester carboxylesterase
MAGDRDAIREEHTVKIFQSIPNSQLCIVPGATHFEYGEKPELFFQIVFDFFDKPFTKPSTVEMIMKQAEGMLKHKTK